MTPNAAITSAAAPNKVDKRKTCAWRADDDGVWHANCGELYVFINGGPRDGEQDSCSTWEAAEKMHEMMCERIKHTNYGL